MDNFSDESLPAIDDSACVDNLFASPPATGFSVDDGMQVEERNPADGSSPPISDVAQAATRNTTENLTLVDMNTENALGFSTERSQESLKDILREETAENENLAGEARFELSKRVAASSASSSAAKSKQSLEKTTKKRREKQRKAVYAPTRAMASFEANSSAKLSKADSAITFLGKKDDFIDQSIQAVACPENSAVENLEENVEQIVTKSDENERKVKCSSRRIRPSRSKVKLEPTVTNLGRKEGESAILSTRVVGLLDFPAATHPEEKAESIATKLGYGEVAYGASSVLKHRDSRLVSTKQEDLEPSETEMKVDFESTAKDHDPSVKDRRPRDTPKEILNDFTETSGMQQESYTKQNYGPRHTKDVDFKINIGTVADSPARRESSIHQPIPSIINNLRTLSSQDDLIHPSSDDPIKSSNTKRSDFFFAAGEVIAQENPSLTAGGKAVCRNNEQSNEIIFGKDFPHPTLNRSISTGICEPRKTPLNTKLSIYPPDIKPGDGVSAPRSNDVLFPLAGMAQWPGVELFQAKIESRRNAFLNCDKRSHQAKIAFEIIREVIEESRKQGQPATRFLTKQTISAAFPGAAFPWIVMDETSILVQLGKAFRQESDVDKKKKKDKSVKKKKKKDKKSGKDKKHEKKKDKKKRKNKSKTKSKDTVTSILPDNNENVKDAMSISEESPPPQSEEKADGDLGNALQNQEAHQNTKEEKEDDPLVALKSLYQMPTYAYPALHAPLPVPQPYPYQQHRHSLPPAQRTGHIQNYHYANVQLGVKRSNPAPEDFTSEPETKRPYQRQHSLPTANIDATSKTLESSTTSKTVQVSNEEQKSNENAPQKLTSKAAAFLNEGELVLPKGVTIRPSGKWQAQTYFAGQSRYVGVYSTSRTAAHAYRVVQFRLKIHRQAMQKIGRDYSMCTKDELARIFASARNVAEQSVKKLQNIIDQGNYVPVKTEQELIAELGNEIPGNAL